MSEKFNAIVLMTFDFYMTVLISWYFDFPVPIELVTYLAMAIISDAIDDSVKAVMNYIETKKEYKKDTR